MSFSNPIFNIIFSIILGLLIGIIAMLKPKIFDFCFYIRKDNIQRYISFHSKMLRIGAIFVFLLPLFFRDIKLIYLSLIGCIIWFLAPRLTEWAYLEDNSNTRIKYIRYFGGFFVIFVLYIGIKNLLRFL